MKILHIISQSPDFTGSGKFIQEIIRQSKITGHENYLVAGAQADFEMPPSLIEKQHSLFVRFDGVDLDFPIPGMSDIMPYKSSVFSKLTAGQLDVYQELFEKKIKQAIDQFKPDILHTHHLWLVSAIARKAAKDIPMVTTCHGTCLRQHHLCLEISDCIKQDLSEIDRVIALSRDQKVRIQQTLNIPGDRISIISGGYNKDCFFPGEKSFNGVVQILYAGKLSTPKGVPWLLKSLGKIKQMPFLLHLAGNAGQAQKDHCLSLARKLGSKAVYHGPLSHDDLGDLMRKSHIFVLPSFYEGLPLVLMEALACGCRIVTTALPGVHEIFAIPHPDMVTLVDLPELETIDAPYKKDEKMMERQFSDILARSITSVIKNPVPDMDYVRSASVGFTWDKIFSNIDSVYRELV